MGFMILLILTVVLIGIYIYFRMKRLAGFYKIRTDKRSVKVFFVILTVIITFFTVNIFSTIAIVLLHVVAVSAVLDLIVFVVKKIVRNHSIKGAKIWEKIYGCGIIPIVIAAIIMGYGFYNMGNVVETDYTVATEKNIRREGYRVALITDMHYGTVQKKKILKDKINEINQKKPDIVILGGDIVEEGTSKDDMEEVFAMLGGIKSNFGIYYVYGNHDRQPYTNNRTFTNEELENTIKQNNINILEDDYVEIGQDLILAGRGDAAWENDSKRASVEEILKNANKEKFIIMVDHQPIEAEENRRQGVDIELSGHTHAGQIWPVGIVSEWMGQLNYGEYQIGQCKVIVSSGFAGWAYPIRTGKHSEYVIVDIS